MAYGDADETSHKTGRIAILCITLAILGLFLFLFKVDACAKTPADSTCREEFVEMRRDGYSSDHKCSPGALIETVSSPPAPKAGILCHCPKGAPASSAPTP